MFLLTQQGTWQEKQRSVGDNSGYSVCLTGRVSNVTAFLGNEFFNKELF